MEKVYVVRGHRGEYSDYGTWPVAVMADEAKANEYAETCQKLAIELEAEDKKRAEESRARKDGDPEIDMEGAPHPLDPDFDANYFDTTTYDVAEVPWKEQV